MDRDDSVVVVRPGWHPLFQILVSFPIACFTGALLTDIAYARSAYARSADMLWADFSAWLLAAGMVTGLLAGIAGLVDVVAKRRIWPLWQRLTLVIGGMLVLTLALFDNLVHSRDAWTSVVPAGLALSAITVFIMLVTAWLGAPKSYRRVVAVQQTGVRQ